MKAERVILSFVAIVVGLVAAGVAFYFYQMTKTLPKQQSNPVTINQQNVSPTPAENPLLTVESPKDEEVFAKKLITINGKTDPQATVIISSEDSDQVVKPSANGTFTLTHSIPEGTTLLTITAVFPNGEETKVVRTVTYSSENF